MRVGSVRNSPRPEARKQSHPLLNLRIPPLVVCLVFGAAAWGLAVLTPSLTYRYEARSWVAVTFLLTGIILGVLGVVSFRRVGTTVNPMKPDAANALVVSGVYQLSRNPMCLGFLSFLLAEIAWLANVAALPAAVGFVLYLNRYQIRPEEEILRARFGPEFDAYAARVRRWL